MMAFDHVRERRWHVKTSVGFVGFGSMGAPIARNLLAAGFPVRAYNRTVERAAPIVTLGAALASSPADAVAPDGVVITMLADDAAVKEVVFGQGGVGDRLGPGGLHVSMSTIAPETARSLAEFHAERGAAYVAAPVFGRPEAAAAKKLWVCVSGPTTAKARVRPLLEAIGQGLHDFGEKPDAANVVKLAGNFLIMAAMEAIAEAQTLGEKHGLDRARLGAFFGETIFACPVYQNYGRLIANQTYEPAGFRLALGLKDANLVLGAAAEARVPMPVASLLRDRFLSGVARGRAALDWSAIARAVSEEAGLE
jgi:3-hydroxyisobutyrate dehydrogenase-like beta-hydroxyacid dehydrogenase